LVLGQLYEANRDCIDPTTSVDIVDGPDPGLDCAPTCLVTPAGQNGAATGVYVTTECGAFAALDDTSGSSPYCARALAALARSDVCLLDGGSSCPAAVAGDAGEGCPAAMAGDASTAGDAPLASEASIADGAARE
jgi:hypothetical protein